MALHLDLVTARLFVAVVEEEGIARAAERENIAPSAVSKRISELEQRLGVALLRRHHRGVETTPAGAAFLRRARALLREAEHLERELREHALGEQGHIRLYTNESALVGLLPAVLRRFMAANAQVRIDLVEAMSEEVVRAVEENLADIGIYTGVAPTDGLVVRPCYRDSLVIVVPPGHPLAARASASLAELLEHDMVGPDRRSSLGVLVARGAADLGMTPRIRVRADGFDATCLLVQQGFGAGLVAAPFGSTFAIPIGLVAVPLREPWARREHWVCVRDIEQLSSVAMRLLGELAPASGPAGRRHAVPA
jgi:DNA-binding transcriptional LysR family regulator